MATGNTVVQKESSDYPEIGSEVESVDPSRDLVIFEDIPISYPRDEDIFVIYQLGRECTPSSRDWIGLCPTQWTSTSDYVIFEWAPKLARDEKFPFLRSVLFRASNISLIPTSKKLYQFLYVTKQNHVIGVSQGFRFVVDDPQSDFDLFCVERPLQGVGSLTFIESQPWKRSLESFEIVQPGSSNTSRSSSKSSGLRINQCFQKTTGSARCSLKLDLLDEDNPVHASESSVYNLDLLFGESDDENEEVPQDNTEQYYQDLICDYQKKFVDPLVRLEDICDSQWGDTVIDGLHGVDQSQARTELSVVVYQPHDVVLYYGMDLEVFKEAGPAVASRGAGAMLTYVPEIPIFNLADINHVQCDRGIPSEEDEDLLTPISSRRFKPSQDKEVHDTPNTQGLEYMCQFLGHHMAVAPIDLTMPYALPPNLFTSQIGQPNTSDHKADLVKRKKKRCSKCRRLSSQLKTGRRCHLATKRQFKKLQQASAELETDMILKSCVLDDLTDQVKAITHDNNRLKVINSALAANSSAALADLEPFPSSVEDLLTNYAWFQQSLQALQQENSDLKDTNARAAEELDSLHKQQTDDLSEWHVATSRRTARHLSMIASQEKVVTTLHKEVGRLEDELQLDRQKMSDLQVTYEAAQKESRQVATQLTELQVQLDVLQEKEASLSRLLVAERRKKTKVYIRMLEERNTMKEQIQSLENALEAGKLLQQRQKAAHQNKESQRSAWSGVAASSQTCLVRQQNSASQTNGGGSKVCQTVHPSTQCPMAQAQTTKQAASSTCAASGPVVSDPAIIAVGKAEVCLVDRSSPTDSCLTGAAWKVKTSKNFSPKSKGKTSSPGRTSEKTIHDYCDDIVHTAWNSKQAFHEALLSCKKKGTAAASRFLPDNPLQDMPSTSSASVSESPTSSTGPSKQAPSPLTCWADLVEQEERVVALSVTKDAAAKLSVEPSSQEEWKPKAKKDRKYPGRIVRFAAAEATTESYPCKFKAGRRVSGNRSGARRHIRREE